MLVGVMHLEVHLPEAGSLKQKRQAFKGFKERLRTRYNVSVAEDADLADLWQRAGLVVVSIASQRDPLERLFEAVERDAESQIAGYLVSSSIDYLELDDAGGGAWGEDWDEGTEGPEATDG